MTAANPEDSDALTEHALWLPRLAATADTATIDQVLKDRAWRSRLEVAREWRVGRLAWEIGEASATAHGIEQDRMSELLGCVDSISERIGLALAAGNEVALWQKIRETPSLDINEQGMREMSQRAMAALFGYYLLATGHNLAAIAIRCLALERAVHQDMQNQLGTTCAPGVLTRGKEWPSLNVESCRDLRKVARSSAYQTQRDLVDLLSEIARHPSWVKLDESRGEDYHRRRPTSAPLDGAPSGSAWTFTNGVRSMAIGRSRPRHDDKRAEEATALLLEVEQLLLDYLPRACAIIEAVIKDIEK